MRFIEDLCPPALLFLIFVVIQLGFDAALGLWVTFLVKLVMGFATVVVLDMFCGIGLGVVSWFLVAMPFVVTSLATAIAMGTGVDDYVMEQFTAKEKFYSGQKMELVPAGSNQVNP